LLSSKYFVRFRPTAVVPLMKQDKSRSIAA
jgi:hypothetical protein